MDDQGRLWPAVMAVGAGRCFVADDVVPVVAEIDPADGRVVELFSWTLSPPRRHLPTTTAAAITLAGCGGRRPPDGTLPPMRAPALHDEQSSGGATDV